MDVCRGVLSDRRDCFREGQDPGGRRVVEPTFGGPSVDRMGRKEPSGVSPTGSAAPDVGFLRGMPGASVEDAGRLSGRGLSAEAAKHDDLMGCLQVQLKVVGTQEAPMRR